MAAAAAAAAAAANNAVDALKQISTAAAPVRGAWGSSDAPKRKPDVKTVVLTVPKQSPREVREATLVRAPPQSRSVARPLRSSDSPLIQARALQPSGDALARHDLTKKRRKKRRKKKQARDDVHGPGTGGGKILPKKMTPGGQNTDKQKMKALELWTTARLKTKAVTTVAATLTNRQRRQAARQIHRNAESERWDVDQVYKEIFWSDPHNAQGADTLTRARTGAMDRDHWRERCAQNPYLMDKLATIDGVTRKLRATFTRLSSLLGKSDWDSVFAHYDTDKSGGVDRNEFIRAVRVDAKVDPSKLTDHDLDELFKCIDTGDGLISSEELRLFLSVKKDMKRREMSGKLKERHDAKQREYQANNKPAIFNENVNDTERTRGKATMFVAEFIAMAKVQIRAGSSLSSPKTGFLEPGETVVVTAVDRGYRLRVLRLKWGVSPTSGWVSERLDRERISQLREMYRIYTFMGTKQLDANGKVQDESTSPRLSKERQFASQIIGACGGDLGEIEALVTRLEQTPRAWWFHMLAEEWPHALQALSNRQVSRLEENNNEQEHHTEAPLQPTPPSAAPPAAAVSTRRRPVSASAASGASTGKPIAENVEVRTGDEGAASVDESEKDRGDLEQTGSTELSMQPAPPTGSRPAGPMPTARIHRGSKSKIDDVLRRYSPRRNPDRVAVRPGEGTSWVDLPQNWATPQVQPGDCASTTDDKHVGVGVSDLEKENEALRKNLELLEENASLRRRIDELES